MKYRWFNVVFLLWLYGCSGGISGTGDGGPVIPIGGTPIGGVPIEGGDVATGDNTPEANSTDGTDGPVSSLSRLAIFPNQLILDLPRTLQTEAASQSGPDKVRSPGVRLREGITASQLDSIAIQIDLFLLDSKLNSNNTIGGESGSDVNNSSNCAANDSGDCFTIDRQFDVTVDVDAEAYTADLLAPYAGTPLTTHSHNARRSLRSGDTISFTNVSLQSNLSGYYDYKLQYSRVDGSRVTLQWSSDQQWVSLLAQNIDSTLYSLLQTDSGEMTLRRTNHLSGNTSIQLIAIQNTAAVAASALATNALATNVLAKNTTFIEADLNDDEPFFMHAIGDDNTSAIFSESLLTDVTRYREATDSDSRLTNVETCIDPCALWQSTLSEEMPPSQALPNNFFDNFSDMADTVARSLVNPIDTSVVPQTVNEFVVAIGDATTGMATDPNTDVETLVCGGQRLSTGIRTFCWQPTPFDLPASIFEESSETGAVTYRFITQSNAL